MNRNDALPYVSFVLDDSLSAQKIDRAEIRADARLVGWQCGFEPLFIAVQSYLPGVRLSDDEAADIALSYLMEKEWFRGIPAEPDYIL